MIFFSSDELQTVIILTPTDNDLSLPEKCKFQIYSGLGSGIGG